MVRNDARGPDKMRPVRVTIDYIKYAEGSCLIELGNTRVVCTASVEESVPSFLRGSLSGWVTAEYGMIPRSCKTRINRDKNQGRTYEIQRLIGRSLRAITDLKALGERTLWIDCDVIQADGGTRTASITGSFIALALALADLKKKGKVKKPVLREYIAATSVGLLNNKALLDLTYEEDSQAEVDMNIIMTDKGEFVEIQGTAERSPFSHKKMDELVSLAQKGIYQLIAIQRQYVEKYLGLACV